MLLNSFPAICVFLGLNLLPLVDCLPLPCAFPSHLLALVSQQMENPSEANLVSDLETVSVRTRTDINQLLSPVPVVTPQNLNQLPATQNQLMSATMQPSDSSNFCKDAQLVAIPTTCPQFKFVKFIMTKLPSLKDQPHSRMQNLGFAP